MSGAGRTLTARAGACSSGATRARASDAAPLPAEGAADKQQRPKQSKFRKPQLSKGKGTRCHTKKESQAENYYSFFRLRTIKRTCRRTKKDGPA